MKRIYTLLLLSAAALTMNATVKPRYRTATTAPWVQTEESADADHHHQRRTVGVHDLASLGSMGSPNIPVILVQFADKKFISGLPEGEQCETQEQADMVGDFYDLFCNGLRDDAGYCTEIGSFGAIREFFRDQSAGQFTPNFHVIGPVTLDQGYAYYGKNSGSRKDVNIKEFYKESLLKAQELQEDWTIFDNNGDGTIDMAFFIFAGEGENGGGGANTIWPKEEANGGTIEGVQYGCYACCNETYKEETDGIGVFVHELSHALGLPDFYDYNYVAYGLDYWDVMDSGCYCQDGAHPCGYSAYEKDFMGWQPLITLSPEEAQHLVLAPQHAGGQAYKIVSPDNANEYFIIENRQNELWDTYIGRGTERTKMHGLLISHIDFTQGSWTGNRLNSTLNRQRYSIIPADGDIYSYMNVTNAAEYNDFYLSVIGDLFPGAHGVTEWLGTESVDMAYRTTEEVTETVTETIDGEEVTHEVTNTVEVIKTQTLPVTYNGSELNQPLRNIVELEDGTIELDYCPDGKVPTAIAAAPVCDQRNATLYTLSGQAIGTVRMQGQHPNLDALPAGIYIVNKQKYVVR